MSGTEPAITPQKLLEQAADWFEDEIEVKTGLADEFAAALEGGNKLEFVRVLAALPKAARLVILVESLE